MATGNFFNNNASDIFAIFQQNEYDDFIYDDVKDSVYNDLDAYIKKSNAYSVHSNNYYRDATIINKVSITDEVAGVPLTVSIELLMRSGYYEGANLDYEINYNIDSIEFDDITDAFQAYIDVATYTFDLSKGLATIQARHATNRLETLSDELIENVEKILKDNCTHVLQVSARFTNGETWYSEVKKS